MDRDEKDSLENACRNGDHRALFEICRRHQYAVYHKVRRCSVKLSRGELINVYSASCLHLASGNGHVECCRVLLTFGADVEARDFHGRTPLMYAGRLEVVQLLLSQGANVCTRDHDGMTVLHHRSYACLDKRCVGKLVSAGASVSAVNNLLRTPLTALIRDGPTNVQELDFALELVKQGADANTTDENGRTLLHLCVGKWDGKVGWGASQRSHIISELVELGANLDAHTKEGKTALHVATENGHKEAASLLAKLGTSTNAAGSLESNTSRLVQKDKFEHTGLSGQLMLKSPGADANTCSNQGGESSPALLRRLGTTLVSVN